MNYGKYLLLVALAGCSKPTEPAKQQPAQPVRVRTVAVARSVWRGEIEATGTVTARVTAAVSGRVGGHIRELRVREGDRIAAGQVIAAIDAREIDTGVTQAEAALAEISAAVPEAEAGLRAAQARLELASVSLDRMKRLQESRSITDQEFDEVTARARAAQSESEMAVARRKQIAERVRQASAAVERARLHRGDTSVLAPFAGVVVEKKSEAGVFVAPGAPIVVMERAGDWRLDAAVQESHVARLKPGTRVAVLLDALDARWDLPVSDVLPAVDAGSRTATVRIALPPAAGVRGGMSGRIRFPGQDREAVTIDENAIERRGQLLWVYVVESGRLRAQLVTAGERRDGRVEIVSGLEGNERLVANPPANLRDGSPVEEAK